MKPVGVLVQRLLVIGVVLGLWACDTSSTPIPSEPAADTRSAKDTAATPDTNPVPDTAPIPDTQPLPDTSPPPDTASPVDTAPSDLSPPFWPQTASFEASHITASSVKLSWTAALDDIQIAGYSIQMGQETVQTLGPHKTSAIIEGLSPNTTYALSVIAQDAAGNSSAPLTLTVTTGDAQPPIWPQNASMKVVEVSDTTATVSWTPATDAGGVEKYYIMQGPQVLATAVGKTEHTLTGLIPWTPYTLTVVAQDEDGNTSSKGPEVSFKTTDSLGPTWPKHATLSATAVGAEQLDLTWSHAKDAVGVASYTIKRDKVVLATTQSPTTTATITGLEPNSTHTLSVWATDIAGNLSADSLSLTVKTNDTEAPTWPESASLIISEVTPTSIKLAWSPAKDDVGVHTYTVHQNGMAAATTQGTHTLLTSLKPWTHYTFHVVAADGAQNSSLPGPKVSQKTPDHVSPTWPQPAALTAPIVGPHGLTLVWTQATDDVTVKAYHIFQDGVLIAKVDAGVTTFNVSGLSPWTDYTFKVVAHDPAGNTSPTALENTFKTTDIEAPEWMEGALIASALTPTTVRLTWPQATDDVAVTVFKMTMNGVPFKTLTAHTTLLNVDGLDAFNTYAFEIWAEDAAGNTSKPLSVSVTTPDLTGPTWPEDGALEVSSISAHGATLVWPDAQDNVGIGNYIVSANGLEVATLGPGVTTTSLTDLSDATSYEVAILAKDLAGNPSTPLTATFTTLDGTAPVWDENAAISASPQAKEVALSWQAATDNVGVVAYRVFQDGAMVAETESLNYTVKGLTANNPYEFRIQAGDAAGNWSTDGPVKNVTTSIGWDKGPNALNQASLFQCQQGTLGSSPSRIRRLERLEWTHHAGKFLEGGYASNFVARDNPLDAPLHFPYTTYSAGVTLEPSVLDLYFSVLSDAGSNWIYKGGWPNYFYKKDATLNCMHPVTNSYQGTLSPSDECIDNYITKYLHYGVLFRPPTQGEFDRLRAFLVKQLASEEPAICGDDICNGDELTRNCAKDCGTKCGDGTCNGDETDLNCDADCQPGCGNGVCDAGENHYNCVTDCDSCLNGVCTASEDALTCPQSCQLNATVRARTLRRTTSAAWLMVAALFKTELGNPNDDDPNDGRHRLTDYELARALGGMLSTHPPGSPALYKWGLEHPEHPGFTAPPGGHLADIAAAAGDGSIQEPFVIDGLIRSYIGGYEPNRYDMMIEASPDERSVRGGFWLARRVADFFREWLGYTHVRSVYKDDPGATSKWSETAPYDEAKGYNFITLGYNNVLNGKYTKEARLDQQLDDTIARVVIEDTDVFKNLLTTRDWRAASNLTNTNDQPCETVADCTEPGYTAGCTTIGLCGSATASVHELHRIYNRSENIPATAEGRWITLPDDERAGVLTHPTWLAAHGGNFEDDASLVHRGHWVREKLFCESVPPLELVQVEAQLGPSAPDKRARDRVQEATEAGDKAGTCGWCHSQMNPLGYPFEIYNHAGYLRYNDHGHPPDGSSVIDNAPDPALNGPVQNAVTFSIKLSNSNHVKRCFIRQAFRFFMGRDETMADACALSAMEAAYDVNGSFIDMLAALATTDTFLYRHHKEPEP